MPERVHACGCVTTHDNTTNSHAFVSRCDEHPQWITPERGGAS